MKLFSVTALAWLMALHIYASESAITMLQEYWPIFFIAIISATVANATAVGGGFIFMPMFSLFYNLTPLVALKLVFATQAFGMGSGTFSWPRHLILWNYIYHIGFGSSVGMILGTFIWVPSSEGIHLMFGWASLVLAVVYLREFLPFKFFTGKILIVEKKQKLGLVLICVLGGTVTAWISIGIGEFVALWLMLVSRHNIAQSIATGVLSLAFCSILGFLFHGFLGGIRWDYLLFTVPGVILGGNIGAKIGYRLSNISSTTSNKIALRINPLQVVVGLVILFDGIYVLFT